MVDFNSRRTGQVLKIRLWGREVEQEMKNMDHVRASS